MAVTWSTTWPTEIGYYWFFGVCWRGDAPELCFVKVRRTSNDALVYITNGHFLWRSEGANGFWQPAVLPELPTGI